MNIRNQTGEQIKQTTVEEGTEFKGTLNSTCPVVVRGVLDGDIRAPSLTVHATGTVVGNVNARSIHSEGVLAGSVDAEDVSLSGSVRSNTVIRARTLEVKLARDKGKLEVTFGECILEVGDEPAVKAKDSASAAPPATPAGRRDTIRPAASQQPPPNTDESAQDMSGDSGEGQQNGKRERLSVPPAS